MCTSFFTIVRVFAIWCDEAERVFVVCVGQIEANPKHFEPPPTCFWWCDTRVCNPRVKTLQTTWDKSLSSKPDLGTALFLKAYHYWYLL